MDAPAKLAISRAPRPSDVRGLEMTYCCGILVRDGLVKWVEVCYCATPLEEERPYWEEYFDLVKVQDAHARTRCKDLNGTEYWACSDCDCTEKLESRLATWGPLFLDTL